MSDDSLNLKLNDSRDISICEAEILAVYAFVKRTSSSQVIRKSLVMLKLICLVATIVALSSGQSIRELLIVFVWFLGT